MALLLASGTLSGQETKNNNPYWIGQELWYKYSGGMEFHIEIEEARMSYQALKKLKLEKR